MTRIDFYLSSETSPDAGQRLACRLVEKAYKMGHKVYIHTESEDQAQQMDDLLWTFRDGSFVPHGRHPKQTGNHSPVLIGHDSDPQGDTDVLINLTREVPPFFSRFERVAEVVDSAPVNRTQARERYRFYRDRGYELQTHEL